LITTNADLGVSIPSVRLSTNQTPRCAMYWKDG